MRGILADHNNEGHVHLIMRRLQGEPWREFWIDLKLASLTFKDLRLEPETPDAKLWQICQSQQVILITINRNADGPDSLEVAIRTKNSSASLPVLTLANARRLLRDGAYLERVVERLLEYLIDMEKYRGAGRLYLP